MTMCLLVLRFASTAALLYCIRVTIEEASNSVDIKFVIHCILLGVAYLFLGEIGEKQPILSFGLKVSLLFLHIGLCYRNKKISVYRVGFIIYTLWDLLRVLILSIMAPCVYVMNMMQDMVKADITFSCIQFIGYILINHIVLNKKKRFILGLSYNAQMGIFTCCIIVEFVILEFRRMKYNLEDIRLYRILLVGIIFSCIVIVLWILDKREEQKKIRELTSYVHKTREIIPSVGRALKRLEEMPGQSESAERLLEELRSICEADAQGVHQEVSYIKTFESTGCFILDEQLGRYMEEACEKNFQLDIIVRASVDEILETEQINRYQLLQLIGDLYRNAYKVVLKRNGGGHILMCFGYNMQGFYEISIYDNGAPFPVHILNHLGERGVTTDGSGHGMADIFAALKEGSGSFDLNQNMPPNSIFTKGICIIFDGQARVQIQEGGKKK